MSHSLDFSKHKAAIAYNAKGGLPWHGYGEAMQEGENWSLDDWVNNAGLDFTVRKAPAFYQIPNPNFDADTLTKRFGKYYDADKKEVPPMLTKSYENRAVLYRSDTGEALSVMSDSHYVPMQPRELLAGLMDLTKGSGFEMEVAGALKGGRVVWGLAKRIDGHGDIAGDIIKPYVLLLNSYDGTYARTGRLTSVRVVCQNTVSLSGMMDGATTAKQRNSAEFSLEKANLLFDKLGEFDSAFSQYLDASRAMANVRLSDDMLKRFFAKLYAPEAFKDADNWQGGELDFDRPKVTSNARNNMSWLLDIFHDSPGSELQSANGTLWGALNACTFYHDHAARTKDDKRWESATIGNGNRGKDKALELAMSLI